MSGLRDDFYFVLRRKIQTKVSVVSDWAGLRKFDPNDFKIDCLEVTIPSLSPTFHRYTIVHISDIHYGQWISADRLKGVVDIINAIKPDVVAITGDFVSYLLDEYIEKND